MAALVAAGLVAAIVVILTSSSHGQGPLDAKTGGRNAKIGVAQSAAIGQAISVSGPLIVQNTSDNVVVLDRVELVGLQRSIYRGAYVLPWPPNQTPFTGALTYRIPRDGRIMPGATVAPHAYAWIVIGLTAKRGQHEWTRTDIVYHYRGATYRRHAALVGAVCAPRAKYRTTCDPPGFG